MNRLLPLILMVGFIGLCSLKGQTPPVLPPPSSLPADTRQLAIVPRIQSPVDFFRQLLAMTPAQLNNSLTNRSPEARARILTKVHEYQKLAPNERELRLRATELRWWLTPMLRMEPQNRASRLSLVPGDLRGLVDSRLRRWDLLPPPLKDEMLANDRTLHYFARVDATNSTTLTAGQQKLSDQFNQLFDLTAAEKQSTLSSLSEVEREQMEKTLKTFEKLPPQQRYLCIRNYAKFAGMSPAERATFLKNAESWSKLPPQERQAWRDLVAQIPQWPPMPPPRVPANIIPPTLPKMQPPGVATN